MEIRVADYIAKFLVDNGIEDMFSVVGGGSMYLNDAFGHTLGLRVIYNHHEQACTMAAESYARMKGKIAAVCVTTGPGGTNAITGVLGGYQDSIPMLIISGQVRYNTTVESTGLNIRQFGDQEFPIVSAVKTITKYAVMVKEPLDIKYHLQKAFYLANDGRRGPCWLDIPLNVQGAIIDTDNLKEYLPPEKEEDVIWKKKLIEMLMESRRPVMLVGSSVRTSGAYEGFMDFKERVRIPILATAGKCDILPMNSDLFYGNEGSQGGRAGNFIIQNADLLIAIGCRMSFQQIGFNYEAFSPKSKRIIIDVDEEELKKDTIKIDLSIHADMNCFFKNMKDFSYDKDITQWIEYCNALKIKFPLYQKKFAESDKVNPYQFGYRLQDFLKNNSAVILGNSVACVCVNQMGINKQEQRMYGNINCGAMGYDIPAAIGAAIASDDEVICVTGDGSFQMNIQELQTIVCNHLPIKLFVFNNGGYQAIMQTQLNFFGRLSGANQDCGISMPSLQRIAYAYGIPFIRIEKNSDLERGLDEVFSHEGSVICELIQDINQGIEPRSKSMQNAAGQMVSPPLDNLYPFLPEDEYESWKYENYIAQREKARGN